MKIATNRCHGGFTLSEAIFNELKIPWTGYGYLYNDSFNIESENDYEYRAHPELIAAIEKIGESAAGRDATDRIQITEIPDNVEWKIYEYYGWETIHEIHRCW